MRQRVVGIGFAVLLLGAAVPARAQFSFDARRIGMAGLNLTRGGELRRYNAAYRSVPARVGGGQAKLTIPIPLGLIQFFHDHPISKLGDDPLFNQDSAGFNPVEVANLLLNLPLFYEVKKAPTPTNDVEFTVGKDSLIVNLGRTQVLVPSGEFGFGGSSRLMDFGFGAMGFRVGVMGFLHEEVGLTLNDSLRAFLKEAHPAHATIPYGVLNEVIAEAGFAPSLSFSGRIAGDSTRGLYLGLAAHYYLGVAYGQASGSASFRPGSPIFSTTNLGLNVNDTVHYSKAGNSLGHGVGGDVGVVWISGPLELGLGVNDIGATLTWSDVRVERETYSSATDSFVTVPIANHVQAKTKLPVSYIANVAFSVGATTVGANLLDTGRGTTVHVGGEQRLGPLTLRSGIARDQRKKLQFGWGGGLRFGFLSLDVGFWTHSNALSDQRAITMATSVSIY